MNLSMDLGLATEYRSRCQIARVVTEGWAEKNLYCPSCDAPSLNRSPDNTRAVDFWCNQCEQQYQLKSGATWSENRIVDAGYSTMIAAIRSDRVPNLFVMQYSVDWWVYNLLLIPFFFFIESAIQKRKPLGLSARRAGWVGCNFLLDRIPPDAKIPVVDAGEAVSPAIVRKAYKKVRPLEKLNIEKRGWTLDVLNIVRSLKKNEFVLSEVYDHADQLAELHPQNHHIHDKIRQQLQVLRDLDLLEFLGAGSYRLR